ncbi:MAG: T9SS type A sorting domain-containing protein [Calditrichaeota bacterium]|nr:T9SS type A sorting domain-containing protein [Calditrichota bacterium]
MHKFTLFSLTCILTFTLSFLPICVLGEISVDPAGVAVQAANEEVTETAFSIINNNDIDYNFNVSFNIVEFQADENEEEERGPVRDDPGEIIREFDVPYFNTVGMAWDEENGWMWGIAWSDSRLYAMDPVNGDVVFNGACPRSTLSMFYSDGLLYIGGYNNSPNIIFRYDTQGRQVDNIRIQRNLTWSHIAGDDRYIYVVQYPNAGGQGEVYVLDREDNYQEIATIDCGEWIGDQSYGVVAIHDHRENWLWLSDRESLYQFRVDEEWNAELVRQFETVESGHTGLAHDGENLWRGIYDGETRLWYVIDDGVPEKLNVTIEPDGGAVEANGDQEITITIAPENSDIGVYIGSLSVQFWGDGENPEITEIDFSLIVSLETPVANISGLITDAATGEPLEGAQISLDLYTYYRIADDEGGYAMNQLPRGVYNLTFTAPDYLMYMEEVDINEGEEIEVDHAFLHSEFLPDPDEIFAELALDSETELSLDITNGGNGPLTYSVSKHLLGDADSDPWTLRQSFQVGELLEDGNIYAAVYINDHFYIAGGNNNQPVIYVLNRDGELLESFDQPGESRRGIKDMTYDGELFWAADEDIVYGFSPDGEVQTSFEAPYNPTTIITWDCDRECLWLGSTTRDPLGYDRAGNQIENLEVDRSGLRIYGMSYWQEDPDDSPLYLYHRELETNRQVVHKVNIEEDDTTFVAYLDPEEGGNTQGCFITNQFDHLSWVMLGIASISSNEGGDRLNIWQVANNTGWFNIDPDEGVIDAESTLEFGITLNSTGLIPNEYSGEFVFAHDGIGGLSTIPVTLNVGDGPRQSDQRIGLRRGWNMVSAHLEPEDPDVIVITSVLVENETFQMMKNGSGQFYNPQFNFNNIPGWNVAEGYWVKMSDADELVMSGMTVDWDLPIPLLQGWQMISYYPAQPVDATIALSGLVELLLIAKDEQGRFYSPPFGFSNMGEMEPGKGYQLKLSEDAELVYRLREEEELAGLSDNSNPVHFQTPSITSRNMSLLVYTDTQARGEIGAFCGDQLVGFGLIQSGQCGVSVWGDDRSTNNPDGLLENQSYRLVLWDAENEKTMEIQDLEIILGDGLVYHTDEFTVVKINNLADVPNEFYLSSAYPNPFNMTTVIPFGLSDQVMVNIGVYDVKGRLIQTLRNEKMEAGHHKLVWEAKGFSTGIYFVRMDCSHRSFIQKAILVK